MARVSRKRKQEQAVEKLAVTSYSIYRRKCSAGSYG